MADMTSYCEAVREVSKIVTESTVAGLCRANQMDIDRCAEAIKHAKRGRIHIVIATSPLHMKHKLQMEPATVLDAITRSVTHARNLCGDVEWSAEDATRSEPDFLRRAIEPDLDRSGLGLRLRYLSGGMSSAARLVAGRVIPERSGYYLGFRMTEALVAERGLAAALRAPVADFQAAENAAHGIQTA